MIRKTGYRAMALTLQLARHATVQRPPPIACSQKTRPDDAPPARHRDVQRLLDEEARIAEAHARHFPNEHDAPAGDCHGGEPDAAGGISHSCAETDCCL